MTTAGMPTAGMPTAGMPTAGMPTAGMPTASVSVSGQPTTIPPMGQTTAGMTTAAVAVAGQPFTTQTTDTITQPQTNFSMGGNAPIAQINPGTGLSNTQIQTTAGVASTTGTGVLQGTVDGNCICPLCGTTAPMNVAQPVIPSPVQNVVH
ncbi:MAG: hypothetical protein OMM_15472 [Candidatus Magnetoglobus multicellularis str. Araruama]|uniref:Uncharacterized protein n=2 Tax=Candidatus Magnetoglobus multicellularis TaxID=418099 RepID=F4ZYU3_9BACT|nr:hypothetical protein OMM_14 [Candidatus Magnetoglobus multicellularis]ETR64739.1 MAG: hypothetical protein OMM_15472 [Candidatus Magnetoglobus multicellularis str. Araruama]